MMDREVLQWVTKQGEFTLSGTFSRVPLLPLKHHPNSKRARGYEMKLITSLIKSRRN